MSESKRSFPVGNNELQTLLKTGGITALIDGYIQQRRDLHNGQEIPETEKDPYAWVKARNATLDVPLEGKLLDYFRVFCNGIPSDGWQALDEQARQDIMTNMDLICHKYGAFTPEEAYYPGTVVASAYTVMEGVLLVKAATAQTMGMQQAERVSLQNIWFNAKYAEWMHTNLVDRVMNGEYCTPADKITRK